MLPDGGKQTANGKFPIKSGEWSPFQVADAAPVVRHRFLSLFNANGLRASATPGHRRVICSPAPSSFIPISLSLIAPDSAGHISRQVTQSLRVRAISLARSTEIEWSARVWRGGCKLAAFARYLAAPFFSPVFNALFMRLFIDSAPRI